MDSKVAQLGGMWEQNLTIGQQRDKLLDYLQGFTVDLVMDGNHECRSWRTQGESQSNVISLILSAKQNTRAHYLPHGGFVTVEFNTPTSVGDQRYVTYMHHGEGAPTQLFNRLMSENQGSEVLAAGHTHQLSFSEAQVNTPQGYQRVFWVRTGGYINDPAYAARKPSTYGKTATGSYIMYLHHDQHRVEFHRTEDLALTAEA
jgi:hypothetical protein